VRALALVLATAGGAGYAPVAPGTAGSLVALPLLPALAALRDRSAWSYAAALVLVIGVAVWSAGQAERVFGRHDDGRIVVDEVAGMAVSGILLPGSWGAAALAFVVFRVLDVLKPFPAGLIDRRLRGGIGVVGDDLVAGSYAALVARLVWELV